MAQSSKSSRVDSPTKILFLDIATSTLRSPLSSSKFNFKKSVKHSPKLVLIYLPLYFSSNSFATTKTVVAFSSGMHTLAEIPNSPASKTTVPTETYGSCWMMRNLKRGILKSILTWENISTPSLASNFSFFSSRSAMSFFDFYTLLTLLIFLISLPNFMSTTTSSLMLSSKSKGHAATIAKSCFCSAADTFSSRAVLAMIAR